MNVLKKIFTILICVIIVTFLILMLIGMKEDDVFITKKSFHSFSFTNGEYLDYTHDVILEYGVESVGKRRVVDIDNKYQKIGFHKMSDTIWNLNFYNRSKIAFSYKYYSSNKNYYWADNSDLFFSYSNPFKFYKYENRNIPRFFLKKDFTTDSLLRITYTDIDSSVIYEEYWSKKIGLICENFTSLKGSLTDVGMRVYLRKVSYDDSEYIINDSKFWGLQ